MNLDSPQNGTSLNKYQYLAENTEYNWWQNPMNFILCSSWTTGTDQQDMCHSEDKIQGQKIEWKFNL